MIQVKIETLRKRNRHELSAKENTGTCYRNAPKLDVPDSFSPHSEGINLAFGSGKTLACKSSWPEIKKAMETHKKMSGTEWLVETVTWAVLTMVLFYA